jgi:undecaprenyl-diphosphatase
MDDQSHLRRSAQPSPGGQNGRAPQGVRAPAAGQAAPRLRLAVVMTVAVAAVFAGGFIVLAMSVSSSPSAPAWDQSLLSSLAAARTPFLTVLFRVATLAGEWWTVTAVTMAAVVALLIRRKRACAVLFAVAMSVAWLVESLTKILFHRTRPPASEALIKLPASYSFPSGHAFVSFVLCALLVYVGLRLVHRVWARLVLAAAALVVVVLVGMSRVYLGVHWPSDVLGSWSLAATWISLCLGFFTVWRRRRDETRDPVE